MYWSIIKTFINGKETPIIPLPTSHLVNNNLISNFREKVNIFNIFFVQQSQPIANNSILPTNQILYTQNRLRDFDIDCTKILKLVNGLNPHNAHGHGGMSTGTVKLCNLTITKPLSIIHKTCLQQGFFFMISSMKITFSAIVNLDSDLVTLVYSANCNYT